MINSGSLHRSRRPIPIPYSWLWGGWQAAPTQRAGWNRQLKLLPAPRASLLIRFAAVKRFSKLLCPAL